MVKGYYGVYVEKAYVLGEAPDVLRTAVGQRSRWCKVGQTHSYRALTIILLLHPYFCAACIVLLSCMHWAQFTAGPLAKNA